MTREEEDCMIREHEQLVRNMVRHFLRTVAFKDHIITEDDLHAWGLVGLWRAVQTFDASKGASFQTHALLKIRWAIQDGLRRSDRLQRHLRKRIKDGECPPVCWATLPDGGELAEALDCPPWEGLQQEDARNLLRRYVGKRCAPILDALLNNEPQWHAAGPLRVCRERVSQMLAELIDRLKESSLKDRLEEFTHA
jgi:RNA polymerase sigma factor (sigma-70 family)